MLKTTLYVLLSPFILISVFLALVIAKDWVASFFKLKPPSNLKYGISHQTVDVLEAEKKRLREEKLAKLEDTANVARDLGQVTVSTLALIGSIFKTSTLASVAATLGLSSTPLVVLAMPFAAALLVLGLTTGAGLRLIKRRVRS